MRPSTSTKRQQYFQGESPKFTLPISGLNVHARFLEVVPEAINFLIQGLNQEELTVILAEFLLKEMDRKYSTIKLDSDGEFTDEFLFDYNGKLIQLVGTFTLYCEDGYYFIRLSKIL